MAKLTHGFAQFTVLAVVGVVVIIFLVATARSTVLPQATPTPVSSENQSPSPSETPLSSVSPTATPQPTAVPKPQGTKTPTPKPVTSSLSVENSDKSMAFYYTSVSPEIDPFTVSYNNSYLYKNAVVSPKILFLKPNDVVNAKQNEIRTLTVLNMSRNAGEFTTARKWEDNSNLLSQTCYYGATSECRFFMINAIENAVHGFAAAKLSNTNGYLSVSRLWDWFFVQNCSDGKPCDIKVYLIPDMIDIPNSFDQYEVKKTIQTTKYLVPYHAEEESNDRNRTSTALFHMSETMPTSIDQIGDDGLLIFYIRSGEVHRQNL